MIRKFTPFQSLIMTSSEDCRISLNFHDDVDVLKGVLEEMGSKGIEKKTHRRHIEARIRKLEKLAAPHACTGECRSPCPSVGTSHQKENHGGIG